MLRAIRLTIVSTVGVVAFACAATASAAIISYSADLSGSAENPPNNSPGTGTALVTVDTVTNTLRMQVEFSALLGETINAHIHCCTESPNNAAAVTQQPLGGFPLFVNSGSYDQTFDMMLASSYTAFWVNTLYGGDPALAWAALLLGLSEGQAYFNIHTTTIPGGEIRGFLREVPEPGSMALLGLGLTGLGLVRRRRL